MAYEGDADVDAMFMFLEIPYFEHPPQRTLCCCMLAGLGVGLSIDAGSHISDDSGLPCSTMTSLA